MWTFEKLCSLFWVASMLFSSLVFLFVFLPIVLIVYFVLGNRFRNACLLFASLFFYTWGETYLVYIILISIIVNYLCGLLISSEIPTSEIDLSSPSPRTNKQKTGLFISILCNLGMLGFFKYFNFGLDSYNFFISSIGLSGYRWESTLQITLPLGISFFTFQAMSYTIDIYRGNVRATRNLLNFATYISLFPQLIAGPIVRYKQISDDLMERTLSLGKVSAGIKRFSMGLGKKVIIANTVAWPADQIFSLPESEITTSLAWFAIICYGFQIYFDFSGYSDMAIGIGLMFGFSFPENFNFPYTAQSIQEFWQRWHISLSSWFRDYLYIPLGGNQKSTSRTFFNLLVIFLLCGLWHGASWTFVIWGLYHGLFLIIERTRLGFYISRLWRPLRHVYALITVLFGWVLFRAETFSQALVFFQAMLFLGPETTSSYSLFNFWNEQIAVILLLAIIGSTPWLPILTKWQESLIQRKKGSAILFRIFCEGITTCFIFLTFLYSIMLLSAQTYNPFIYFRF